MKNEKNDPLATALIALALAEKSEGLGITVANVMMTAGCSRAAARMALERLTGLGRLERHEGLGKTSALRFTVVKND